MTTDKKSVTDQTIALATNAANKTKRVVTSKAFAISALSATGLTLAGIAEVKYAPLQKMTFSWMAANPKTSTDTPPALGPVDVMHGYNDRTTIANRLKQTGNYDVSPQKPWKQYGVGSFQTDPIFTRPQQAGLWIVGDQNQTLYRSQLPRSIYEKFEDIPEIVINTLREIEDQNILQTEGNPAINVPSALKAVSDKIRSKRSRGASTLAVQLEKNRSYENGRTKKIADKFKQMMTASVAMNVDGADKLQKQQEIVREYLNTALFAAHPQAGEVQGLKDAMAVWFGRDNYDAVLKGARTQEKARVYRQFLTLTVALQQNQWLKVSSGYDTLQASVAYYVDRLERKGVISKEFATMVRAEKLPFNEVGANPAITPPTEREKFILAERQNLFRTLGLNPATAAYQTDRWHMRVDTGIDAEATRMIDAALASIKDPVVAKKEGLIGENLLNSRNASGMTYSVQIMETMPNGTVVTHVNTDTSKGAHDLNRSVNQSYGSTGKLYMAIVYQNAIATLHSECVGKSAAELQALKIGPRNKIARWAVDYMSSPTTDKSLGAMLDAALDREYSAAPRSFGSYVPRNFKKSDNNRSFSVRAALAQSINIVYFAIAQDMQEYVKDSVLKTDPDIFNPVSLNTAVATQRASTLKAFFDEEGTLFQNRFWKKMHGKSSAEITSDLAVHAKGRHTQLAVIYLSLYPKATYDDFNAFMQAHAKNPDDNFQKLYDQHRPQNGVYKFDLNDRGYLARMHPLRLSAAARKIQNPDLTWTDFKQDTAEERQHVYKWVRKKPAAQNRMILAMLNKAAWAEITKEYKSLGYPYDLRPSPSVVANASNKPQAMGQLLAILQNGGREIFMAPFTSLVIGEGTPHETRIEPKAPSPRQILHPEVVTRTLAMMSDVVQAGTAKKLKSGFEIIVDGKHLILPIFGKTGTHDANSFGKPVAGASRVVAFMATIGPRFNIVIAASGQGDFTSGLATQLLKNVLHPAIRKVLEKGYNRNKEPKFSALIDAMAQTAKPYDIKAVHPESLYMMGDIIPADLTGRLKVSTPYGTLKLQ